MAEKDKQAAMHKGLSRRIQSPEFLLDLVLIWDVLFELSELSEILQDRSMNNVRANRCVRRATRGITGTKMMIANDSVTSGGFGIVRLCSNHRHVSGDHNALIHILLDAMKDRLFATTASGTVRTSATYQKLLDQSFWFFIRHIGHKMLISTRM